jgi:hypothetical protein
LLTATDRAASHAADQLRDGLACERESVRPTRDLRQKRALRLAEQLGRRNATSGLPAITPWS